jgi:hypothetical protein
MADTTYDLRDYLLGSAFTGTLAATVDQAPPDGRGVAFITIHTIVDVPTHATLSGHLWVAGSSGTGSGRVVANVGEQWGTGFPSPRRFPGTAGFGGQTWSFEAGWDGSLGVTSETNLISTFPELVVLDGIDWPIPYDPAAVRGTLAADAGGGGIRRIRAVGDGS